VDNQDVVVARWKLKTEDKEVVAKSLLQFVPKKYEVVGLAISTFYPVIFSVADKVVSPIGYASVPVDDLRVAIYHVHKWLVELHQTTEEPALAMNTADIVLNLMLTELLISMDGLFFLRHIDCMELVK